MNLYLLAVILLSAAGQILVKLGADRTLPEKPGDQTDQPSTVSLPRKIRTFIRKAANPYLLAGFAAVAAAPLLYTRALASLPLSRAYGTTALTLPLVMLGSRVILGERISFRRIAGGGLIVLGFLVWNGIP